MDNKIDELIYKINNLKLDEIKKPSRTQQKELIFGVL